MIWQFTRRDPAWQWAILTTFAFTAPLLVLHFVRPNDGHFQELMLCCLSAIPLAGLLGAAGAHEDDKSFQAILPVTLRQIFAVRMMAAVTMLWLPFAVGAAILFALGDSDASEIPPRMWLLVTCIELAVQCATIRGFPVQAGLPLLPLTAWLGFVALSLASYNPFANSLAEDLALVCCWVLCAALIARTWLVVPASVQLEPKDASPAADEPAKRNMATGAKPWKAVLLTFYPPSSILRYLSSFLWMSLWYAPTALVFVVAPSQDWLSVRNRVRWMRGLPVSPRAIWLSGTLPDLLFLVAAYVADIHLPFLMHRPQDADIRTQVVTILFIAILSLTWNLGKMAIGWRPVGRLRVVRWAGYALMSSLLAGQILLIMHDGANPVKWLSRTLPATWLGIIGVAILPLFALLAAMDWLFRQQEFL